MTTSTERRPSRLAKLNAGDKIKDQMDHLLYLASGRAYLDDEDDNNNDNDNNNINSNEKETIARPAAQWKRRPAEGPSDTERATATQDTTSTSAATGTDVSKKARSRSKRQKTDEGDGGGEAVGKESLGLVEVAVKRKPGRPKKQQSGDLDTSDQVEPSTLTTEVEKKRGRPKKQKAGDGDSDATADQDESSIPAAEIKRKLGRLKKQEAGDVDGDATANQDESSIPAAETNKKLGRPKKQKADDGVKGKVGDVESSMPAEATRKKPGRPKKQNTVEAEDGVDHTEPSVPTEEPKKKLGRPKKQNTVEAENGIDNTEPSAPTEEPKKKLGRPKKQNIVEAENGTDNTEPSVPTEEPKKKLGRLKRQRTDDDKEGEAEHPESTIPTDKVKKKQGRPKKQTTSQGDGGIEHDELPAEEPKTKTGQPMRQRTDQEIMNQVEALMSAEPKRRQGRPKKETGDVSESDDEESLTSRREAKTREGRTGDRLQQWTIGDIQENSSDYRQDLTSKSDPDSDKDGSNYLDDSDDSDDSGVQSKRKTPTGKETEMDRVARVPERERGRQEKLDGKEARSKAKKELKAKNRKRVRQSFLAIPVSVQLAHAAENMAIQDNQQQPTETLEYPALDRHNHSLIYQVLKPEQTGLSYRWPVREELLHSIPKSSFASATDELDDIEKHGLGFVEELTGVPKNEEDYSGTDAENDNAGSNEDVQETGDEEDSEGEDDGDQSAEESAKEKALRRRRELYATRARKNALEGLLDREEPAARDRGKRHEDERFANARLEAVQALFDGEIARFAQVQYRKGVQERVHDLEQFQKSTLSESYHQAVRAPIGSELSGFDQEDDLTRLQQRAIAFSAEDAVRKSLDRMAYVVRQGSLLRMPAKPRIEKAVFRNKYERGWDTVMTSAALAGIDDRILKKVSMRMQNLLSKSKNIHHYEVASEGKWMTVEDAIDRAKDPSSVPPQEKAHFVDPMDPAFDPRVLALNAKHRRHKEKHAPVAAAVKQQLGKGSVMISTTTRSGPLSPVLSVSSGSSAGSRSGSRSESWASSNLGGTASESGSGSESESESSHNSSDDDDADGSG
ncbi:hypothetical protein KI688_007595 [Linnemannia hyalina]|uniref:Uncharacterized protein n=1 Tax=Linnemannia hyalina TaxID=64524 RepID=A0A9P8BPU6_9FUNG|nr:hypothetical protein KI688_007595 [Linnemannia hyalina]